MAKKTPDHIPERTLALYEAVVATCPEVERKGAANPYTSRNGHMFSYLGKDAKMALRLPADAREAFLKKHRTTIAVSYGAVMKEYVVVPDALLKRTAELARHFRASYDYIGTLKPKPTTRKKAAGGKKTTKKKVTKKKTVGAKTASKRTTKKKPAGTKAAAKKKVTRKKVATKKPAARTKKTTRPKR